MESQSGSHQTRSKTAPHAVGTQFNAIGLSANLPEASTVFEAMEDWDGCSRKWDLQTGLAAANSGY
jgi:hypothetical protein